MVNLHKTAKAILLYAGSPLLIAVVAGYIVERIKGTPPGEIAAAFWHPFGIAINGISSGLHGTLTWLCGPAQLTHFGVLVLLATFAWLAFVLRRFMIRLNRVDRLVFYDSL